MKCFSTPSFALFCAATALALPCLSHAQKVNYTTAPWEVAVSGNFTRADVPALAQSVAVLNTQLTTAPLTPMTTGDFGMPGAAIDLQHNFQSCLGFQLSVSGGYADRKVLIPAADAGVFSNGSFLASPKLFTAAFGPVFTIGRGHHVEYMIRVLGGVARANVAPGAAFESAVNTATTPFAFTDTAAVADGGFGVSVPFSQHFALRFGVDDLSTWLSAGRQDQLRASAGIVWKFGQRSEIFDPTPYE